MSGGCGSAAQYTSPAPPPTTTLLVVNENASSLRVFVGNRFLGVVSGGTARCLVIRQSLKEDLISVHELAGDFHAAPYAELSSSEGWVLMVDFNLDTHDMQTLQPFNRCR